MFLVIDDFLTEAECAQLQSFAVRASYAPVGKGTDAPADHKHNLQFSPKGADQQKLVSLIGAGLNRRERVRDTTLVKKILPPILSKYEEGMAYASHLDSPIMHDRGAVRTDLSMTVFLSDPKSYDGGALVLESDFGEREVKPPAGGAVVYSTRLYHRVQPVTRGARFAMVTWMQSHVADPAKRKIIGELWRAYDDASRAHGEQSEESARILFAVTELIHIWADG